MDKSGFEKVPIFPYSVKYASSFYGPFRDAVDNNLEGGDRKTHQMDFKNSYEFIREVEYDINEGCDAVIIKPAMINSAAEKNLVDELELTMEIIYSIKRAGATAIVTYSAVEIAKKILSN